MKLIFEPESALRDSVEAVVRAATEGQPLPLLTSGTTGASKTILRDLAAALLKKKAGQPAELWLLTYSPDRWAGVSVILHVMKAGATLCVPGSLAFDDIIAAAHKQGITHLSLTPSMFRNLLMHEGTTPLRGIPVQQLTFGGEAATQSVLDLARKTWPTARISHVYAATELGDICSVSDGLEGVPTGKFDRFSFTGDGELVVEGHSTGDIWEKRGERYFFIGRVQEIINVGGNKVSPVAVEEFAIRCGARFARAFAIPSPLLGALVGLEYVGDLDRTELQKSFRQQFPKYMCPAQITQVEEIQLSAAGKTRRLT
jgi:acyl-CoA synthetase (AMP-forming)/AMP-acid ligase II